MVNVDKLTQVGIPQTLSTSVILIRDWVEVGRYALSVYSTVPWLEGLGLRSSQTALASLCFLTADAMGAAASHSCHHAFPTMTACTPELWAKYPLVPSAASVMNLIPAGREASAQPGTLTCRASPSGERLTPWLFLVSQLDGGYGAGGIGVLPSNPHLCSSGDLISKRQKSSHSAAASPTKRAF